MSGYLGRVTMSGHIGSVTMSGHLGKRVIAEMGAACNLFNYCIVDFSKFQYNVDITTNL